MSSHLVSTMDVKSLIQQWYRELAEDALEFEAQAQRVGVWDQQLRENQKVSAASFAHTVHALQNRAQLFFQPSPFFLFRQ